MASDSLPAVLPPAVVKPTKKQVRDLEQRRRVAELVARGVRPNEIARRMSKDPDKRKQWRRKIWRWLREDMFLHQEVASYAQAELMMGLGPATRGLVRRASRGYTPAIKLLYEASGFYRPTEKHEHSGEIRITVQGMARPEQVEDQVVDATVVDD